MSAWNDFLEKVKQAESELGNPREIWYRGHSQESWKLNPSLHRYSDWESKEKELFSEFSQTASRLFDKRNNDWEILFDMQHYWIPTRLLDWTTVMGFDYKSIYWEHSPVKIEKPIAVRPHQQSARLLAQKGVFTVHGNLNDSFENNATNCYRKIILPNEAKDEARTFLKWANLDEYTIYPDIVGMSQHIKRKILKGE